MATNYVRKTGLDANNGSTIALANLTIAGAITDSSANDTIDIGAGTYTENLVGANSRTYKGAGMFLTIINGVFSASRTAGILTIQDLKIIQNANQPELARIPLTLNRVYWSSVGYTISFGFDAGYQLHILNSIIYAPSGGIIIFDGVLGSSCINSTIYTNRTINLWAYISTDIPTIKNSFLNGGNQLTYALSHTYNAYDLNNSPSWGLGTGEFTTTAAACFVDPVNGDFTLKSGSPLINKGLP